MMGGDQNKIYDGKISGIVTDAETQKPVELANVALSKAGSDKPIDGVVTDEKGNFKLKNIKPGKYKVSISFIGYLSQDFDSIEIADKKNNVDLGKILFKPNTKLLKEAVVEGQKPLVETQIDKLIYNNDRDLTSKGGNATDVLRKVPMVTVDLDGNVTLQGTQNIKVLVNNKPSSIMANSVADAMKMIPADEIEKVEVITSPSAKYDAEGTGGIINIITKKKNVEGISGAVYAGAGTRSSNLYASINYHKERFGTGLNIGGFEYYSQGKLTTTRTSEFSTLTQSGDNKNYGYGPFIQWTTDYDFNSKNNISTSLRLTNFNNHSDGTTNNTFNYSDVQPDNNYTSSFSSKTGGWNYDASMDYKKTFKTPDQELTASAQINNNSRNIDYDITNTYDSLNYVYLEKSRNESRNREITFQTDYVHPFSKKIKLETGAKSILRNVLSDYQYHIAFDAEGPFIEDTARSNIFDYTQNVFAGYLQGSVALSRFGIKAGGRFEQTEVHGEFDKSVPSFSNSYHNLLPSITVSYKKAGRYNLKLSYTQRIQRPGMTYLNPYVNTQDQYNISHGNPELEAEHSHAFELGYNIFRGFGSINSSFYHRFTHNSIESIRFINSNDVYVTTYDNIGKNYSTGTSVGVNYIWKLKIIISGNINVYYYKVIAAESPDKSNDGINYSINLFASYKFNEKWGVQTFGNFNGPKYSIQGKSTSFFYYNLSLRRSFKGEKGGIGLGLDNFATPHINFRNVYQGDGFTYDSNNRLLFFGVRLSFDYRFGKMEFKQSKKHGIKNDDIKEGGEDNPQGGQMGGGK